MSDRPEGYPFQRQVTQVIRQHEHADYLQAAEALNHGGAQVAFIQHEFGIFGGPAGDYVLDFIERLKMPVVATLHTVLSRPDEAQRRVMEGLIAHAATLVVMAKRGVEILQSVYGAPSNKILVIPHGAPTRSLAPTTDFKRALGLSGRKTLLTFGLLSPNKGIETVIRALPAIINGVPDATYVVAGATHPHLVRREGETYRESLVELAKELKVADRLVFLDRYLDDEELIDVLQAADVYVTPYLTETQITSGTLSYALAIGRPVVSTPYWHAQEALADGVGVLCPFGDDKCFASAIISLLKDDEARARLGRRAYMSAQLSRWPAVGRAYVKAACDAHVTVKA